MEGVNKDCLLSNLETVQMDKQCNRNGCLLGAVSCCLASLDSHDVCAFWLHYMDSGKPTAMCAHG